VLAGAQPRNQIFLSASQRQANKFRREIVGWVKRVTGVELKGNPIMLDLTGLTEDGPALDSVGLYPLSTNSNTAQGESGDFYFDEFFWVHGFAQLRKVAAAMATHTIYKRTYFSTLDQDPRGLCVLVGRGMEQGPPPRTAAALRYLEAEPARRGHDARWKLAADRHARRCHRRGRGRADRPRGTAAGIERRGIQQPLRLRVHRRQREQLPFARIAPARVDSFYRWRDFRPALIEIPGARPFADKPVWLGYDPNKQGRDDAALAVVAPPEEPGGKFRVLEKLRLNGRDFAGQADAIREVARRYHVTDISIDTTGHGLAVWELVSKWFPLARKIEYSVASKTALVIKGQNVFRAGRIEFDAGWTDVMQAFMAIRPTLTGSQRGVTYTARRNGEIGHADIAWAILHALSNEPLDAGTENRRRQGVRFLN
jgi:hypothetical protein